MTLCCSISSQQQSRIMYGETTFFLERAMVIHSF
jgi:hypothetical protein